MRRIARGAIALALVTAGAFAKTYPAKAIRMIVAYPPGGGTDILARILGQKMCEDFGAVARAD